MNSSKSSILTHITLMSLLCAFAALIAIVPAFAQKPELVVQAGHSMIITSLTFSPDGKLMASGGGMDRRVALWDVTTGKELRALRGHSGCVMALCFSPDGKMLASGVDNVFLAEDLNRLKGKPEVKIWDVASGKEIHSIESRPGEVASISFNSDGTILSVGSWDGDIRLWDTAAWKMLRILKGHRGIIKSMLFSMDGKTLTSYSSAGEIKLWNIASGEEILSRTGLASYNLSSDGKMLAIKDAETLEILDIITGKSLTTLKFHSEKSDMLFLSPNGKIMANISKEPITFFDMATGKQIYSLNASYPLSFSADGKTLAIAPPIANQSIGVETGATKICDAVSGKVLKKLGGYSSIVSSVSVAPNGETMAVGSHWGPIKLWNLSMNKGVRTLKGNSAVVFSSCFSSNGRLMASRSQDNIIRLWNVISGKEIRKIAGLKGGDSLALSLDGKMIAGGDADHHVRVWDTATGKEIRVLNGQKCLTWSLCFSPDGKWLASVTTGATVKLWEMGSAREIDTLKGFKDLITTLSFSPNGEILAIGTGRRQEFGEIKLWSVSKNKEIRTLKGHSSPIITACFSGDGKVLAATDYNTTTIIWDVKTGKEIGSLKELSDNYSLSLSHDGRIVVSGGFDGIVGLWDAYSGKKIASLIALDENDWAVVTPGGLFDASPGGMKLMHWVVGLEPIDLSQLKERYYEPGLLQKILGFNKEPLRRVEAFDEAKLFPEVKVEPLSPGSKKLTINLKNRGGGIGRVQVFVNDKEIVADARCPWPEPDAQKAQLTVDLSGAPLKLGEKNSIRVVAWNGDGYLSSRGSLSQAFIPPGETLSEPPHLWAIVAGISEYGNNSMNLRFASKDAEDMAKALEIGGRKLFGPERVHLTLLTTSGKPGTISPTKENLIKAFEAAKKAKPKDVLIIYLAGHGVCIRKGSDVYCYLTRDARSADTGVLSDPEVLKQSAITSDELTEWIKQIPALKQVMILDTCAAGAAAAKLTEKREISSDQIRAIDRLKDRTGFHILMGCASDAASYEASHYGQGILTYTLLQGMKGAALRDNTYVDVSTLFQYAADRVPELAINMGGIQRPVVAAPEGTSFDVGRLERQDKQSIPLAAIKPLILRPLMLDPDEGTDHLNLTVLIGKHLKDESFAGARGGAGPSFVYVDSSEMPGAIRPGGIYRVYGQKVKVKLTLTNNGKKVRKEVEGSLKDTEALAAKVVSEIVKASREL